MQFDRSCTFAIGFLVAAVLSASLFCREANAHGSEVRMSGAQLLACEVALVEFRKRNLKLENYSVIVREHGSETEVVLLPNRASSERFNKGGRTSNGSEIHYFIAANGELKRLHFAR